MEIGDKRMKEESKEKIALMDEMTEYLNDINKDGVIEYNAYSDLFDFAVGLLDEMYDLGKKEKNPWVSVLDKLPSDTRNVFIKGINDCGMDRTAKAKYCRKFELEIGDETNAEWCDYKESTETYYCPEGWYESNTSSEIDFFIDFNVTDWQELPETN